MWSEFVRSATAHPSGKNWSIGSADRRANASKPWKSCEGSSMEIYRDFRELLESFNARRVER
jgi:hypothetical protein